MKAMVLEDIAPIESNPLKLRDLPMPTPAADQVRVKVLTCGLCRTDLHVVEGDLPRQDLPIIPGHQIVGAVNAVGDRCKRLYIGQRIGIFYERDIHSVTANTRQDGREFLAEAAQVPVKPVTTVYNLDQANQALQYLKYDRITGTGVLKSGR